MTDRELDDCARLSINPEHVRACALCGKDTVEPTCDLDIDSWAQCRLVTDRWRAGNLERARDVLRKHGATL